MIIKIITGFFCFNIICCADSFDSEIELRLLRDVTERLAFKDFHRKETWILASLIRGESEGAKIEGAYVQNGELFIPSGAKPNLQIQGTCEVIATLTGGLKSKSFKYGWKEPAIRFGSRSREQFNDMDISEQEQIVSPLRRGGIAICRVNQNVDGLDFLKPVFLLPLGWEQFVEPGWKYYQTNPELFRKEHAVKNQEQLKKLLKDANPLLAVQSARTLGEVGILDNISMSPPISESTGLKQAALMYLFWKYTPEEAKSTFVETINTIVQRAKTSEEIKGIALSATLTYEPFDGLKYELQLVKALEQKQLSLGIRTETDRYIDNIVRDELEELTQQAKENEERKKRRTAQSRSE